MSGWPRPPRHVPWRLALQTWGVLGAFATAMLVVSLVALAVMWAEDGFRSPRDDWRLDAGPAEVAEARVTQVRHRRNKHGRVTRSFVSYVYDPGDGERSGQSVTTRRDVEPGAAVAVEYLRNDPGVSRMVGTHATYLGRILPTFAGLLLLPELFLVLLYLTRVFRIRTIVRHGPAVAGVLVGHRRPADGKRRRRSKNYRVRYGYRGADGLDHEGWQFVRFDSALDRAVQATGEGQTFAAAFVVHDERNARRARLVAAAGVTEAHD
ncbi:MAG: DUF3592 domain-containing protein [Planctomycetota bacterium]